MVDEVKIGLMAIGLETYWAQFEGLYDRLCGYTDKIGKLIEDTGADIINVGMVDSPEKARKAAVVFEQSCPELIYIYIYICPFLDCIACCSEYQVTYRVTESATGTCY